MTDEIPKDIAPQARPDVLPFLPTLTREEAAWVVMDYEMMQAAAIGNLFQHVEAFGVQAVTLYFGTPMCNALVDALCGNMRNLYQLFSQDTGLAGDDLCLADFDPSAKVVSLAAELREIGGLRYQTGSPIWVLHNMAAAKTCRRATYDIGPALNMLQKPIMKVAQALDELRAEREAERGES